VITPLTLAIFYALFALSTEPLHPFQVALQVAEVTFLPVIIGLLMQIFAPRFTQRIGMFMQVLANVLFTLLFVGLLVLVVLKPDFRAMLNLGWRPAAAIIIMVGTSLAIGNLLGGPSREKRSVLAIASIARNVGLALFIAGLSNSGQQLIPTLLTYMIFGALLAVPYSVWSKRRMKLRESK